MIFEKLREIYFSKFYFQNFVFFKISKICGFYGINIILIHFRSKMFGIYPALCQIIYYYVKKVLKK